MLSTKPLPRSLRKLAAKRDAAKAEREVKAAVKARDGFRCRVCLRKGPVDCHEEKRRGAGGNVSLANSYAVCRICHDLLQSRHIAAEQDRELFDASQPIRFLTTRQVADLVWPSGNIPAHVHVIPEGV